MGARQVKAAADDTRMLRTSERRDFKRCQRRWWWGWREGLKPKGMPATPLWFGTGIHLGLALWYVGPGKKRGPHPAETWEKFCGSELVYLKTLDLTEEQEAVYTDARTLGRVMLEGYVNLYGRDEQKLYIQPEQPFAVDIPWGERQGVYKFVKNELLVRYCGTTDGVWRHADTGELWLDEHKTAKAIFTKHLSLDDQAGSYWALVAQALQRAGIVKKGTPLKGIEYNFLRKGLPDDRPKDSEGYYCNKPKKADYVAALSAAGIVNINGKGLDKLTIAVLEAEANREKLTVLGERSKTQESPLFLREKVYRTGPERKAQLLKIQDEATQMWAVAEGLLPPTMNSTKDCSWDCSFYAMCELRERGGNWEEFRNLMYRQQDPYADHRKSTDE